MVKLTATVVFTLAPETPLMVRMWQKISQSGDINERIADILQTEPGFGLSIDSVEDAEITEVNK